MVAASFCYCAWRLVIVGDEGEIGLRMRAYGANLRCLFADVDMTAVQTLPDAVAVA